MSFLGRIACGGQFGAVVLVVIVGVCLSWTAAEKGANVDDASANCLNCIAYASIGANEKPPCGEFCGPYLISNAYWIDAGRPGGVSDYRACVSRLSCAQHTVIAYMNKFGLDCDGDGEVTCADYARMHKLGRYSCSSSAIEQTPYWSQFLQCIKTNSLKIDERKPL